MTNSTIGDVQPSDATVSESAFHKLTQRIHRAFVDVLELSCVGNLQGEELRRNLRLKVEEVCDKVCHEEKTPLNRWEREMIIEAVLDETFGFGPLEILLKESGNSATLVKGPKEVYVLREEREHRTNVTFRDKDHLTQIIERIASRDGNQVNVPYPLLQSDEDCIVIRYLDSNLSKLEVSLIRWSP